MHMFKAILEWSLLAFALFYIAWTGLIAWALLHQQSPHIGAINFFVYVIAMVAIFVGFLNRDQLAALLKSDSNSQ